MPAILKPFKLSAIFRVVPFNRSYALIVTCYGGFDLENPNELLSEAAYLDVLSTQLPFGQAHDACNPKPRGEVLIAGQAEVPGGRQLQNMPVSVAVGGMRRDLQIFGDRYWYEDTAMRTPVFSEPAPFTTMPLTPDRAFGGADHPVNPAGKGYKPRTVLEHVGHGPLPNIENARQPIHAISDEPDPMLLGALPDDHPARKDKIGTYGWDWVRTKYPEWPDDFNLGFFNTADAPQQLDGFFAGDEPVRVVGMSAANPVIESRLPGLRARCFAVRADDDQSMFEIPMNFDTVWVFGSAEAGGIYFRGAISVNDPLALDIGHLMFAYERIDAQPRSYQHYAEVFRLRTHPEEAPLHMMNDSQLAPPLDEATARDVQLRMDELSQAKKQQIETAFKWKSQQMLAETGLPAEAMPLQPLPEVPVVPVPAVEDVLAGRVDMADLFKQVQGIADQLKQQVMDREVRSIAQLKQANLPTPKVTGAELARAIETRDPNIEALFKQAANLDGYVRDAQQIFSLKMAELPQSAREIGAEADGTPIAEHLVRNAEQILDNMLGPQSAAEIDEEAVFATFRARALGLPEGDPFYEVKQAALNAELPDLSGLDVEPPPADLVDPEIDRLVKTDPLKAALTMPRKPFSYADARAEINRHASPEAAATVGSLDDLLARIVPGVGANPAKTISEAVMKTPIPEGAPKSMDEVKAHLAEAAAADSSMPPLDMMSESGRAFFESADHERLLIPEAVYPLEDYNDTVAQRLGALVLEHLSRGASFSGRDLAGIDISNADLSGRDLSRAFLERGKLVAARLANSNFSRCALTGADLSGAVASGVDLTRANLSKLVARNARFQEATFAHQTVIGADFSKSSLAGARFNKTSFINCFFDDAAFDHASLEDCDFVQCQMDRASFRNARLERVVLSKCQLTRSNWTEAATDEVVCFLQCNGSGSTFTRARLRNAYFFGECIFDDCLFDFIKGHMLSFAKAQLLNCCFLRAELTQSLFIDSNLENSDFRLADFGGIHFNQSNLTHCDFFGANLLEAQIAMASLQRANFHGANLYAASLHCAALAGADFTGANLVNTQMDLPTDAR